MSQQDATLVRLALKGLALTGAFTSDVYKGADWKGISPQTINLQ